MKRQIKREVVKTAGGSHVLVDTSCFMDEYETMVFKCDEKGENAGISKPLYSMRWFDDDEAIEGHDRVVKNFKEKTI